MQRWSPPVDLSAQEKMLMKRLTRVRALFGFLRQHRPVKGAAIVNHTDRYAPRRGWHEGRRLLAASTAVARAAAGSGIDPAHHAAGIASTASARSAGRCSARHVCTDATLGAGPARAPGARANAAACARATARGGARTAAGRGASAPVSTRTQPGATRTKAARAPDARTIGRLFRVSGGSDQGCS
jgi:hypothetical protein